MLSVDLTTLESHAVVIDGVLDAGDVVWEEGDARPVKGVVVQGRLSSAGSGRFYFSGSLSGEVAANCRRCLADVSSPVSDELHLLFASSGDPEIDDSDVYLIEPRARELDLRPAVREQWLLAAPAFLLCREDCKGLCSRCGADLNLGPCGCEAETDRRWADLKQIAAQTDLTS